MKKIFALICFITLALSSKAQQENLLVSQYLFNPYIINPAVGGVNKYLTASFMNRSQWVGFAGAPVTNAVSGEMALPDERMGVGLIIANDRIGKTNQTDVLGSYAYHLKLNNKDQLSFGARVGFSNYNNDLSAGNYWDLNDNVITGSKTSVYVPKFGFGALYNSTQHYYAGFTIPTLLDYDKHNLYNLRRHFYLYGGYNYEMDAKWTLKPSVMLRYVSKAPFQFDINMRATYDNLITGGVSYRFGDCIAVMAEYQANKNFRVGYAYDITISKIRNYSNGTHEIIAAYSFVKGGKTKPKFVN